ncbi:conserved hypothetical ATP binding protein, partial [Necator americanus]
LLPITTDYFPDGLTLLKDYLYTEHQISVVNEHGLRVKMDINQLSRLVFDQLICQRLQRGFQIILMSKPLIHVAIKQSLFTPINTEQTECSMSFNKIVHRLVLVGSDITVTVFYPKRNRETESTPPPCMQPYSYFFQVPVYPNSLVPGQVPDAQCYERSTTSFKPHNLDKLNWSLLDCNIKYRNNSQMFKDEMKSYSSRFMMVPQPETPNIVQRMLNEQLPGASFRAIEGAPRSPLLFDSMIRVLLQINRLVRPLTSSPAINSVQRDLPPRTDLTVANYDQILARFKQSGFVGITSQNPATIFPPNMFLSYDFVNWLTAGNVKELVTRESAIKFANDMVDLETIEIVRATDIEYDELESCISSESEARLFRYGFQLCALTDVDRDREAAQSSYSRWMRVEFVPSCASFGPLSECRFKKASIDLDFAPRDPCPLGEWGRIVYDRSFCESKTFELSIKWFMATGQTVADTVYTWQAKISKEKFYLFPVPEDPIALPKDVNSNPLRCPIRVQVKQNLIPEHMLEQTLRHLLCCFGFCAMECPIEHATLRSSSFTSKDKESAYGKITLNKSASASSLYMHQTGGMFVSLERPTDKPIFFFWAWNHMLTKKYRQESQRIAPSFLTIVRASVVKYTWLISTLLLSHLTTQLRQLKKHDKPRIVTELSYDFVFLDVRALISVDDVMEDEELALGPNGALVFCMEYLVQNLEWLHDELCEGEDDYFIFDCPGQIELYSHLPIMRQLVDAFRAWDFNVCSVFLIDTHFVLEAEKFIAGALTALSAMIAIETPCVNVLTKMDLLSERNKVLVEDFLETDTRSIVEHDTTHIWNERHRQLTKTIAQVLEDYSIVKFVPLNSDDEESIEQLLLVIDTTIQYGEDLEVKDRFPEEQDPEG